MKIYTRGALSKELARREFKKGFDIRNHIRRAQNGGQTVLEFIGTDDFPSVWYERQRYEVYAGLDQEPLLYTPFYDTIVDSTLPRNVSVNQIGPAGMVFEEVKEGGEVKFGSVSAANFSIPIQHYGVGIEYNKDLLMYNELWNIAIVERQVGIAYNALLNEAHLSPFIDYTYTGANQTAASAVGTTMIEKVLRTLEDAVTNSKADGTNPRRGPYTLLVSTSDLWTLERTLTPVPQLGFTLQSSLPSQISGIVAYDGWTGVRGLKSYTYDGVTAGKAYLVDTSAAAKQQNARSFFKQTLQSQLGESDMSRFILNQVIWDTYFGIYVNVPAIAEEVTLPTS